MKRIDRTNKTDTPRCQQCGSTEPAQGFTTRDVIHRAWNPDRRKQEVVTSTFTVCKGTPCGGHLQMAYEG